MRRLGRTARATTPARLGGKSRNADCGVVSTMALEKFARAPESTD